MGCIEEGARDEASLELEARVCRYATARGWWSNRRAKMMEKRIGRVTHYFKHIGVALLDLSGGLKVGDIVHIQGHTTDFTQPVESMEIEHQKVQSVGPGADVALRVNERVRTGDALYKVVEE
jgi:hypothetical protein